MQAVERQPFSVPIREVMSQEGDFSFIQEIRDKGYFNVEYRGNKLTLIAGNYIGQIPLTSDILVSVSPKVPIGNLARIISIANQPVKCLNYFKRTYQVTSEASESLLEAIGRSLVTSLKQLDIEGLYREYLNRNERVTGLRGRVIISEYVRNFASKANPYQLPCSFYELSANTLLNRLIKKAILKIASALSYQSGVEKSLLYDLNYFFDKFGQVKDDDSQSLVRNVKEYLAHNRLSTLRHYYLEIIDVSLIILEGHGVELLQASGNSSLRSLIINLEDAFENYIRNMLRQGNVMNAAIYPVLDGNKEGRSYLFQDNDTYPAKPDLVIGDIDAVMAIGDVKYKAQLSESDRYQLISHASAYHATKAFFVTPKTEKNPSGPEYIGKIAGIEVHHYRLDLDSGNLPASENEFQNWVNSLFSMIN